MTQPKKSHWKITLRGIFLLVTAVCVFGYQRLQIVELRKALEEQKAAVELTKQQEQLLRLQASVAQNQARPATMRAWQFDRSTVHFSSGEAPRKSNVGVPESIDKGMMFDAVQPRPVTTR